MSSGHTNVYAFIHTLMIFTVKCWSILGIKGPTELQLLLKFLLFLLLLLLQPVIQAAGVVLLLRDLW